MNYTSMDSTDMWQNITTSAASFTELPPGFQRLNVVVRLVEGLLSVLTNSLTILAVFKYEFLRTNTNLLICSLAVADLLGGLSPVFLLAQFNLRDDVHRWLTLCTCEMTLNLLSSGLNMMSIMWVSLDRFMYINFPLKYYTMVQTGHVWAAICIAWLLLIFQITLATSFGVQANKGFLCRSQTLYKNQAVFGGLSNGTFLFCTIVILLLYARIAFVAHKQAYSIGPALNNEGAAMSKRESKITKMMTLVLGAYICCYIPQLMSLVVMRQFDDPPQWLSMAERSAAWVWWVNSWMNPFIYAWKSRQFNRGFRLLLGLKVTLPSPA